MGFSGFVSRYVFMHIANQNRRLMSRLLDMDYKNTRRDMREIEQGKDKCKISDQLIDLCVDRDVDLCVVFQAYQARCAKSACTQTLCSYAFVHIQIQLLLEHHIDLAAIVEGHQEFVSAYTSAFDQMQKKCCGMNERKVHTCQWYTTEPVPDILDKNLLYRLPCKLLEATILAHGLPSIEYIDDLSDSDSPNTP